MLIKTLQNALDDVTYFADIRGQVGVGANFRHPQADVLNVINDCYRATRIWVTANGFRQYLTLGAVAALPSAPAQVGETFSEVDFPLTALSLHGVDVLYVGTWYALQELEWEDRRLYQAQSGNTVQVPQFYCLRTFGSVSGAAAVAGKIALFPLQSGGSYKITTLDEWPTTATLTDPLIFQEQDWYDLTVFEAVVRISAVRDGDQKKRAEYAASRVAQAKANIGKYVPHVTETGAMPARRSPNYRSGHRWGNWR